MPGTDIDVVVIGLGYVGLPLAVEAARAGLSVVGFDVDPSTVELLGEGRSHIDDITDEDVARAAAAGFRATCDHSVIATARWVVVCVPTPLAPDGTPDLSHVLSAMESVRDHLRAGTTVVLESTTYPGTTDGPVRRILEESGLVAGRDFHLAFSPERIDPGNPQWTLRNTPKIVGGLTTACREAAIDLYSRIVETVVPVEGTREAELAKLLENTYRHVNIALVNEMAIFCHELGIDLWDAIDAAATKPFGFHAFYPGPGVGGHCIPIDPHYLSYQVRRLGHQFRFVELARDITDQMPGYVVRRVQDMLNRHGKALKGSRILLLGLTYKADVSDQRETPARVLAETFIDMGALVTGHDPHVDTFDTAHGPLHLVEDLDHAARDCDAAVLVQNHRAYDLDRIADIAPLVFDTRGKMRHPNVERL